VAKAHAFIQAAPEDVLDVLADAASYVRWVAGCHAGPIAALDNPIQDFVTSLRDRETLPQPADGRG
jgi:hypothetical protein